MNDETDVVLTAGVVPDVGCVITLTCCASGLVIAGPSKWVKSGDVWSTFVVVFTANCSLLAISCGSTGVDILSAVLKMLLLGSASFIIGADCGC